MRLDTLASISLVFCLQGSRQGAALQPKSANLSSSLGTKFDQLDCNKYCSAVLILLQHVLVHGSVDSYTLHGATLDIHPHIHSCLC